MAKKNPIGRPSKYDPKYCKEIVDFFDVKLTKKENNRTIGNELPQFIDFAISIGVCTDTLVEWCKIHKDFSVAYSTAKKLQERLIVANSIQNRYNPYFAQFLLKNNHGWKERQEVEQTGSVTVKIGEDDKGL